MSSRWRPTTLRTTVWPEPVDPDRLVVGVDVPVQQQRRLEPPGEPVQGLESLVRRILAVTGAPRRRVREQHVHAAPVPQLPPARPARQRAGPPGLLARRVLVGAIAVAAAAAEPGQAKAGHVHHGPLGADRAGGPGRPGRAARPGASAPRARCGSRTRRDRGCRVRTRAARRARSSGSPGSRREGRRRRRSAGPRAPPPRPRTGRCPPRRTPRGREPHHRSYWGRPGQTGPGRGQEAAE